jgi:hypothetical protein
MQVLARGSNASLLKGRSLHEYFPIGTGNRSQGFFAGRVSHTSIAFRATRIRGDRSSAGGIVVQRLNNACRRIARCHEVTAD